MITLCVFSPLSSVPLSLVFPAAALLALGALARLGKSREPDPAARLIRGLGVIGILCLLAFLTVVFVRWLPC